MGELKMTKEILKAIRARCDSATAGKWYIAEVHHGPTNTHRQFIRSLEGNPESSHKDHAIAEAWGGEGPRPNDAEFIAHSREDLPRLLDALEAGIKALESYAVGWSGGVGNHAEHHERQYAEIRATRAREALAAIDRVLSGEK